MATEKYTNNGTTTLNGAINNSVTSLIVTDATFFPANPQFRIIIDSEIMIVTGITGGTTFTVTRGAEGTSAASHLNLALVNHIMTAGAMDQIRSDMIQEGLAASRPAAEKIGRLYFSSDTGQVNFDTGSAWVTFTLGAVVDNTVVGGRLTLTTAVPVTTSDVTGATSIYFTPYKGNRIALYTGSTWVMDTFTEITIALGTLTSGKPYDLFAYDNSGTVTFDAPLAWSSTTARATGLVLQDGVLVKSGDATRRYIGTFYTTATTTTEDSLAHRYLFNMYNRVKRPMKREETTLNWTISTAGSWQQANGNSANKVEGVIGWADTTVDLTVAGTMVSNSGTAEGNSVSIGEDSTTTPDTQTIMAFGDTNNSALTPINARFIKSSAVGYHAWNWLEAADGAMTSYGHRATSSGNTQIKSGILGYIEA